MLPQLWLVPLLVAASIPSILTSPQPSTSSTTQKTSTSTESQLPTDVKSDRSGQPIVYTADNSRDRDYSAPTPHRDRPNPNPAYNGRPNTIPTNIRELYDEILPEGTDNKEEQEPDNKGFVDPIDFNSFLSDVGYKGSKSENIPIFASGSDSKDTFANFFGNSKGSGLGGNKNVFIEPNFGGLASSASDTKQRKHEDDSGFVDPNVQFRSLFDSSETANGFRPQDFLGSKDDSSGVEPSKGSQTRAYPSFTYTGRRENERDSGRGESAEDGDYEPQPNNNRYRSSYRQVDSRGNRDREDGDRDGDRQQAGSNSGRSGSYDPYDDSNYYGGEYDTSPPAPQNPRNRQNNGGNGQFHRRQGQGEGDGGDSNSNYSPAVQETSHKPQASGPKAAGSGAGKAKCKKVNKLVDENEDYSSYVDPEPDYDPSTYSQNDRYKRQAGGNGGRGRQQGKNGGGNKRPMTCYVCEDEQGRYAERCSFDSKADPKDGNYYTSSSTSYNDNGRRPQGGRGGSSSSDRYRRNPSLSASKVSVVSTTAASAPTTSATTSTTTSSSTATAASSTLPKTTESSDRDKRQSGGGRNNNNNYDDDDYHDNASHENDGDFGGRLGTSASSGRGRGSDGGRDRDRDEPEDREYDDQGDDYSSEGSPSNNRGSSNNNHDYVPSTTQRGGVGNSRNNDDDNYGFVPSQRRGSGSGSGRDFDFGPPNDFGRSSPSASGSNNNNREFDFGIPREFDPDVQIRTSNTNSRPVFSGSNNNDFSLGDFDTGYDDYIKKYFPGFGEGGDGGSASSSSGSTPGPSPSSTSFRPTGGPSYSSSSPSSRGSGYGGGHGGHGGNGGHGHHTPNKEHTQQSNHFAPPPYFQNDNHEHLDKLIGSFSQKDRSGCEKVQKGDMTCYVCRDARGMNKEECMYAAGDPNGKNTRMAYHESTEYSSPPVSILPIPLQRPSIGAAATPKASSSTDSEGKGNTPTLTASHSSLAEKIKSPLDYDFDY